jgi:hypothetical protein
MEFKYAPSKRQAKLLRALDDRDDGAFLIISGKESFAPWRNRNLGNAKSH